MKPRTLAALAAAVTLVGCPIPQPLPDYPPGTITPPRILADTATFGSRSIIPVPAGCTGTPPQYDLGAKIFYQDSVTVEARWFVDYDKGTPPRYAVQNVITEVPADSNPLVLQRAVPPFTFQPYGYPPPGELGLAAGTVGSAAGVVHVVELVVSNGFDNSTNPPPAEPNRTPGVVAQTGARFEIQTYRWVFVNVTPPAGCTPGTAGCCPL